MWLPWSLVCRYNIRHWINLIPIIWPICIKRTQKHWMQFWDEKSRYTSQPIEKWIKNSSNIISVAYLESNRGWLKVLITQWKPWFRDLETFRCNSFYTRHGTNVNHFAKKINRAEVDARRSTARNCKGKISTGHLIFPFCVNSFPPINLLHAATCPTGVPHSVKNTRVWCPPGYKECWSGTELR